jgi:hypothetical protein
MERTRPGSEATVIPILRDDGTVYFHYVGKTISERLCDWTLAFLWVLVPVVTAAVLLWS